MRSHPGKQSRAFASGFQLLSEESRNQVLRHCRPGAGDPFAAVIRVFSHHALSPTVDTVAVHGDQKNPAMIEAMEARLKKMHERHLNFTQRNGFDFHGLVWHSLNHSTALTRTTTSRPSGPARTCHFPLGRVHSPERLIPCRSGRETVLDCAPRPPAPLAAFP